MNSSSPLSRVASNDPTLSELKIGWFTTGLPRNRPDELVKGVVAALAHNTHVHRLNINSRGLSEADIVPLAELLKTRDFDLLNLGGNDLTGEILLPALAERNSLEVLSLAYNRTLTALGHLSALKNLKELYLHDCGLSAVLPAVLQLPNLQVLNLSDNPLKTLPDFFSSLVNLKQLYVSGCGFDELPVLLLSMPWLEALDISQNIIRTVPDGITALKNLTTFAADGCGLTKFPSSIAQLSHLEVLSLRENKIQGVPEEMCNLLGLKELYLPLCGLTEVPAAIWSLTNLEKLELHKNPLKYLSSGIGALQKLKELDVSSSLLSRLPNEMQSLTQLKSLNISETNIGYLPVSLGSLRSLEFMFCAACPLVGVRSHNTLVSFDDLARLASNSSDPEEIQKHNELLKELAVAEPLRLLRIAHMHLAPLTLLRDLCVAKCAALDNRVDLARLPAHIQDEIVHHAAV
eukprot:TRINITY_DN4641_c0_g1_i2.p1 TRINITY_DN4641_c0_g1~~TRINITY_DN4641_c0_g1_i2.p1  ORF type:complete len:476 (-),score=98.95 TRINITY_DN4641_c0_g1_i2:42-1424(-)